ncbi:MAG: hypothetical protein LBG30_08155 [Odoribacteraceae bacterium]|jgi:hypothetical protein|nr:hypothetical protein [Odoribacteraceae bacterium]
MKKVMNLLLIPLMVSCIHHQDLKENEGEVQQPSETRESSQTTTTDDKPPAITVDYGTPVWTETFKTFVQKIDGKFYVVFRSADSKTVEEIIARTGATSINVRASINYSSVKGPGRTMFADCRSITIEADREKIAPILDLAVYWAPFYKTSNGEELKIIEDFSVVFKPDTTLEQLEKLAKENSVEILGQDIWESNWYHLACTTRSRGDALEMANYFLTSNLFSKTFTDAIANITFDVIDAPH